MMHIKQLNLLESQGAGLQSGLNLFKRVFVRGSAYTKSLAIPSLDADRYREQEVGCCDGKEFLKHTNPSPLALQLTELLISY